MAEQHMSGAVGVDEDGLTPMDRRERDLIEQIEALRREFMEKCEPLAKEIGDIRACRGPEPMLMPDGRLMTYIGPRPVWTPEGIKWPT